MSSEAVARRYARALFELARDKNEVREVTKALRDFADAYQASADLRALERNPSFGDAEREGVIREIGQRLNAPDTATRTVAMLATRQRLSVLPDMVRLLDEMADDHLGIVRAEVRAAQRLSDAYLDRLKKKIEQSTNKNVIITFEEDPTLLAGIVTKIGDRVIDGSIRGRLNRLAESLRET